MSESKKDEMSFWDHLEELRWTLFRSFFALLIFTVAGFFVMTYLFDNVIMKPCSADFYTYQWMCKVSSRLTFLPDFCDEYFRVEVINIKLGTQFFTHMSSSFWLAVLLTFPYLVYEVWRFINPALYPNERKNAKGVFVGGTFMFFVGCAVGYVIVFPMTLRMLIGWNLTSYVEEQISLESYMDSFLMMIFIMGIVFEMPLVCWLLSQIGLLKRSFFRKYRRYAVVGLLIATAIITPSGDPFTLMVVFLPIYGLWELSAFFVKEAQPEEG
ncbi:MAG: twin-arginine translocase subunit TatC [Tannerella sp.]|jgi:sec-independent protein translocase protein TatC|nr:twin-arginine translocase subunit TatC [Tannerella sp.]